MRVATARIAIAVARRIVNYIKSRSSTILEQRIKTHYAGHIFDAYARLDLATIEDPLVLRQLETAAGGRTTVAWSTVQVIANSVSNVVLLVSQISVLYGVLKDQRDGRMIAFVSIISPLLQWIRWQEFSFRGGKSTLHRTNDPASKSCPFSLGCNMSRRGLHQVARPEAHGHRPCAPKRADRRQSER